MAEELDDLPANYLVPPFDVQFVDAESAPTYDETFVCTSVQKTSQKTDVDIRSKSVLLGSKRNSDDPVYVLTLERGSTSSHDLPAGDGSIRAVCSDLGLTWSSAYAVWGTPDEGAQENNQGTVTVELRKLLNP